MHTIDVACDLHAHVHFLKRIMAIVPVEFTAIFAAACLKFQIHVVSFNFLLNYVLSPFSQLDRLCACRRTLPFWGLS
jgi:hypothetical protein